MAKFRNGLLYGKIQKWMSLWQNSEMDFFIVKFRNGLLYGKIQKWTSYGKFKNEIPYRNFQYCLFAFWKKKSVMLE